MKVIYTTIFYTSIFCQYLESSNMCLGLTKNTLNQQLKEDGILEAMYFA